MAQHRDQSGIRELGFDRRLQTPVASQSLEDVPPEFALGGGKRDSIGADICVKLRIGTATGARDDRAGGRDQGGRLHLVAHTLAVAISRR
jgi:hypothetical protein